MRNDTFMVYFDGGDSREWAYGSWKIEFNGLTGSESRFKIEPIENKYLLQRYLSPMYVKNTFRATSNIAEYMTLIRALEWLGSVKEKYRYRVEIFGDSSLVIYQITGKWKCRKDHLVPFRDRIRELLRDFGSWSATWRPREYSVRIFGH